MSETQREHTIKLEEVGKEVVSSGPRRSARSTAGQFYPKDLLKKCSVIL